MKKTIICFILCLSVCFLLVACNTPQKEPPTTSSTKEADSLPDSTTSSNPIVEDCEAPGYFSNLEDFYTYATTGSRNSEDYSDPWTAKNIWWYKKVDPVALLKLEDLIPEPSLWENLEQVLVWDFDNLYAYYFENGSFIKVRYDPIRYSDAVPPVSTQAIQETASNSFQLNASGEAIYVKTVEGVTVERDRDEDGVCDFRTWIGGFEISTSSYPYPYEQPYPSLIAFFENDQLEENVARLKACVKAKLESAS
ncbi:MAG: hypothetical protein IJW30_06750 [Clostridia bacterium]|nr:hypothetical protein [Clostridia bacterium]MBQ9774348.1 hypothetical protein [Clostridia bacterium]